MKKILANKYFAWYSILIVSLYVLISFVKSPGINGYERAMFPEMIYGTAWKPFVYRTLLPSAVRVISEAIPESVHNALTSLVEKNSNFSLVLEKLKWESEHITEYLIAMVLMYFSLIAFVIVFRKLFRTFYTSPDWFINLISILMLFALPPMFMYYSYIYDFPTLFLFTTGLFLLKEKKWIYFLILFIIACFNKETTILLTMIFAIHYYKNEEVDSKLYSRLIVVQLFIFAVAKVLLYFIFIDNPGTFVEFHLFDRNYLLFNGYSLSTYIALLIIILAIFSRWNEKPKFLKDALWIALPLLVLTLFLGFIDELRDYYELFPIIFLLVSMNIAGILGVDEFDNKINSTSVV